MAKREKGSIGLLFELNYFMGIGIMCYLGYFWYNHNQTVPDAYKPLETFIGYQILLLEIVAGVSLLMCCCCSCMQRKLVR